MKVLIAGAGAVGRSIARELVDNSYEVSLIERNPGHFDADEIPAADWIFGDACELRLLEVMHLEEFDVVIAATGDDKANVVLSLLAKTEFAVPRVVARVNDPRNEWLFDSAWGVDVAVSTPRMLASGLVALLLNSLVVIIGILGGYVFSVYVQDVNPGAFAAGITLLTGVPEVIISCVKAALFGLIAGLVACYRGLMISGGGAKAVGNAVNETVVYAFMALFVVNVVVTAIGIQLTTG
jgi:Trk K+ transport system NAD-binding subunit